MEENKAYLYHITFALKNFHFQYSLLTFLPIGSTKR